MHKRLLLIVSVLVLVSVACSAGSSSSGGDGGNTPVPVKDDSILFQDDFSDPNSGWDRITETDGSTDYTTDGAYRIYINTTTLDVWANPGKSFGDVRIEVDATKVGGDDNNLFGVICRYQDVDNFYEMIISSDGYYEISKVIGGSRTPLTEEQMQFSESIPTGNTKLRLGADCIGSKLTLKVNGTVIAEVQDSDIAAGDIGLLAGTFDVPGVEIHFDNLVVRKP